ncbi:hypothetical protein U5817_24915 [Aromatoleum evansii]|uniref:Oxidase n=1 Tax=Aromatoleum evansii TaxID=59406 RepID=A0ABZ1ANA5_AROEV|nr:hypothetical protein U5817_24915 [Aromatoleum evansii]
MSPPLPMRAQLRSRFPAIALIAAASAVPIGIVLMLRVWKGVPIHLLTSDVTSIAGVPAYTGFLSQLGIFVWAGAAAICFFCARLLAARSDAQEERRFLFVSGLLTVVLAFDDLFLLHEEFFPSLGIPEKGVFVAYAAFVLFHLVSFRRLILRTDYILLAIAFAAFAVSAGLDLANPAGINPYLYEDSAKFVGVVSWLGYFFRAGSGALSGVQGSDTCEGAPRGGAQAA